MIRKTLIMNVERYNGRGKSRKRFMDSVKDDFKKRVATEMTEDISIERTKPDASKNVG